MFFMFLLMNHGRVSAKSARHSKFRLRQELSEIPQEIPQDLSAEMLCHGKMFLKDGVNDSSMAMNSSSSTLTMSYQSRR